MSKLVYLSVGEVAIRMGVAPRVISDLLYARKLNSDCYPVVAGAKADPERFLAGDRACSAIQPG